MILFITFTLALCFALQVYLFLTFRHRKPNQKVIPQQRLQTVAVERQVSLPFDFVLFEAGMSHLSEEEKVKLSSLSKLAPVIQAYGHLEIMGLADRTGQTAKNENLAKMRGIAVFNYLVKNGFSKESIKLLKYQVVSGSTPEERKKFRSVKLSVRPK
jgi:outer membrane protein OmpA-like peptidoglycan-associated protein